MNRYRALSNACFATALTAAVIAVAGSFLSGRAYGAPGFWTATGFALVAWGAERRANRS
ncbi:hypothetical protein ACFVUH_12485 [Kitasatospora sp. NPDC058032]|uniref:hypothetical protein n=1 Tax=unclassified Kitasatospora TaxID=2633591 RepID=UPI0033AD2A9D